MLTFAVSQPFFQDSFLYLIRARADFLNLGFVQNDAFSSFGLFKPTNECLLFVNPKSFEDL